MKVIITGFLQILGQYGNLRTSFKTWKSMETKFSLEKKCGVLSKAATSLKCMSSLSQMSYFAISSGPFYGPIFFLFLMAWVYKNENVLWKTVWWKYWIWHAKVCMNRFQFHSFKGKNSTCIQLTEDDFYFGCQKISSEEGGKGKRSGSETNTVSELDSLSSSVLLYLNYWDSWEQVYTNFAVLQSSLVIKIVFVVLYSNGTLRCLNSNFSDNKYSLSQVLETGWFYLFPKTLKTNGWSNTWKIFGLTLRNRNCPYLPYKNSTSGYSKRISRGGYNPSPVKSPCGRS